MMLIQFLSLHTAAAAAKSLQSCLTLCDPIDGSPPDSPIPGILQARILEWVAISFSNAWKWKVKVKPFSHVWLFVTPWTAAHQAPPYMGFSRQECWSAVPLPSLLSIGNEFPELFFVCKSIYFSFIFEISFICLHFSRYRRLIWSFFPNTHSVLACVFWWKSAETYIVFVSWLYARFLSRFPLSFVFCSLNMIWQDTVIVFLDILFYFCHYLSPLHLLLGSFYWLVSQFTDYFLDSVQSTDDPRGALQFCYSVFSFFESFLDFPSLCLHYLLVIVLCPLFPLVNMMLALSLETVVFLPS